MIDCRSQALGPVLLFNIKGAFGWSGLSKLASEESTDVKGNSSSASSGDQEKESLDGRTSLKVTSIDAELFYQVNLSCFFWWELGS